jgi:uncharacterized protein (DUF2141 family)
VNYAACLAALLLAAPVAAPEPTLAVRVIGLHSADGQVLLSLYRGEDGFPGDPARAWKKLPLKISGDRASVDLHAIPPGEYAIAVVHDENANNALDTSWIGIPKEGIGASNDAKGRMGPPKYRDAKFTVTAAGAAQTITIVYL